MIFLALFMLQLISIQDSYEYTECYRS